jgi:DNA-binding NarL/FixJ family response regulator
MTDVTIYIADDHAILVEGLTEILRSHSQLKIIGTASDGEELVKLMNNKRADVVIMDINMPKMNGIQCTEWIKKNHPQTKVIILTMFPEKSYIDQLISAGADGCLLKSRGSKDLLEAIERVINSKSYFDTIRDFAEPASHPVYNLSEREIEIVKLIVNGLTSADIADKLFLSEHTVKTHRKNIFRKTGINSISQLTSFAINNQIVP